MLHLTARPVPANSGKTLLQSDDQSECFSELRTTGSLREKELLKSLKPILFNFCNTLQN